MRLPGAEFGCGTALNLVLGDGRRATSADQAWGEIA
jgi:hypothetical protein